MSYESDIQAHIYSDTSVLIIPASCNLNIFLQFSEIMDKISVYIGKQRKNSEGELFSIVCVTISFMFKKFLTAFNSS